MTQQKILRLGNPILRQRARELTKAEILSPWFEQLIIDMRDTMKAEDGIGLAAPQIGQSVQVAIIEIILPNPRYPDAPLIAEQIFVNPRITVLDPTIQRYWEGCLSVPGLKGLVGRPSKIRLNYLNEKAESQEIEVEYFLATVVQHELDHLDGTLYVDKIVDSKHLVFNEEYQMFHAKKDS